MSALIKPIGKPNFISHYLILKDMLNGVDVRQKSGKIVYLTSRIENIKSEFKKSGLLFDEKALAFGTYASYKPYVLLTDDDNIALAKKMLEQYKTPKVVEFLSSVNESKTYKEL